MKITNKRYCLYKDFYLIISLFVFAVLAIYTIIYYRERILYYDSAFQFFKIIYFEWFNIEAGRYSAILTQIPTILGLKLGCSLKSLTITYSLSFVLYYAFIFFLLYRLIKNRPIAFALVLCLILAISESFFHTVTEIHQGIVNSLVFFAWLYYPISKNSKLSNYSNIGIGVGLIVLSFLSHPTVVFLLLFALGYYLVDKKFKFEKRWLIYIGYLSICILLKIYLMESNSYEGNLFHQSKLFTELLPRFWTLYSFKFYLKHLTGIYLFQFLLAVIIFINYLYNKSWMKLLFLSGYGLLFFIITIIIYHEGNADIAMERIYLPLNFIIAIPFCKDVLFNSDKFQLFKKVLISLIVLTGLFYILIAGQKYQKRIDYLTEVIENSRTKKTPKLIVNKDQLKMELVEIPWAFSVETLILSSLEGRSSVTIYPISTKDDALKLRSNTEQVLLVTDFWLKWEQNKLNKDYFNLCNCSYQSFK